MATFLLGSEIVSSCLSGLLYFWSSTTMGALDYATITMAKDNKVPSKGGRPTTCRNSNWNTGSLNSSADSMFRQLNLSLMSPLYINDILAQGKKPNQNCIIIVNTSWIVLGGRKWDSWGLQKLKGSGTDLPLYIHLWASFLRWEWDINANYTVKDHKLIACLNFWGFLNIILLWSHTSLCYLPRGVKGILQLLLQIRLLVCSPVVLMLTVIYFAHLPLAWCVWLCRQQFSREQPAVARQKYLYLKCMTEGNV